MEFDFGKIIDFSLFSWAKQDGMRKYFVALFIFTAAMSFATYYMTSSLLSPYVTMQDTSVTAAINAMFHFFTFVGLIVIISLVVGSAFTYLLISKALGAKGKKFVEFSPTKWLMFIFLEILTCFAATFSFFKLKLLLVGIAGLVLTGLSIMLLAIGGLGGNWVFTVAGGLLLLLGMLLLLAYAVIIIYNYLRLLVTPVMFIEKERGLFESMKLSWELTHEKVFNILVALIIIGVIAGIISFVGSVPLLAYNFVVGISTGGVGNITAVMDPLFLVLNIPALITSTIATIIGSFGIVGIYEQVVGNAKAVPDVKRTLAKRTSKKK